VGAKVRGGKKGIGTREYEDDKKGIYEKEPGKEKGEGE
jgi:hypothetical protein